MSSEQRSRAATEGADADNEPEEALVARLGRVPSADVLVRLTMRHRTDSLEDLFEDQKTEYHHHRRQSKMRPREDSTHSAGAIIEGAGMNLDGVLITDGLDDSLASIPSYASNEVDPPPDTYNMAYLIMTLLGCGIMFPWNAYITAYDYFHFLYPTRPVEFVLSLANNCPQIVVLLLMIRYATHLSYKARIYGCLSINMVCLAAVPVLDLVSDDASVLFNITITCVAITGICSAILTGSLFGFAAQFPNYFTTALMSGIGVSGVIVAALRIITKLALPTTREGLVVSSYIYFFLASACLLLCIIFYFVLVRLPFARHHIEENRASRAASAAGSRRSSAYNSQDEYDDSDIEEDSGSDEHTPLAADASASGDYMYGSPRRAAPRGTTMRANDHDAYLQYDDVDNQPAALGSLNNTDNTDSARHSLLPKKDQSQRPGNHKETHSDKLRRTLSRIWKNGILVFWTFFVSLATFPGVTSLIVSTFKDRNDSGWFSILLITAFLVFDFVGRTAPRWITLVTPDTLWIPVVARTAFMALFPLCIGGESSFFNNDAYPFSFMAAFALSNGYLSSMGMMFGPQLVDDRDKELAGTVMTIFLNGGISIGVFFSLAMLYFITGNLHLG